MIDNITIAILIKTSIFNQNKSRYIYRIPFKIFFQLNKIAVWQRGKQSINKHFTILGMNSTMNVIQMTKRNFILLLPGLVLSLLVFYKSFFAPITHDEAFSYGVYVPKSIKAILSFKEDVSANNHIINTLFMKLMNGIGFEQPLITTINSF